MKIKTIRGILAFVAFCFALGDCLPDANGQVTGGPPKTSLPTSADGGALGSGKLNFQPDLFTGRFTYSVPIDVPPGRQNSQPNLGLLYNSSVGNGWCGVGWKLELGKIERETRYGVPVLWTNGSPGQYDDSKSFTASFGGVDGHIVKVSPNGQNPAEYRLSVDKSFIKFLYYNQTSNAYWSVVDKGGSQYFFGEAHSNRVDNPNFTGGYGTNTFRWELDRVVDANGNATYITYTNIAFVNGIYTNYELCPLQISYNGNVNSPSLPATNTVTFILTNRTDQTVSFISAFRMESRHLLSQIVVKASGQKVRRYVLNYTNSPSTLRSLLTSVKEYGNDDSSSLPPVTFSYQAEQFGFGPLQSWGGLNSQGETNASWNSIASTDPSGLTFVRFMDMDGDGLPDRVMRQTNSPYNAFVVQRNTGTNFVGNYVWGGLNNQGKTNAIWGSVAVISNNLTCVELFDINGDGKPDRVMTNFSSASKWWVQLNNGAPGTNGFSSPISWTNLANGEANIHSESGNQGGYDLAKEEMIDMNADGIPDRLIGQEVQFNTGNGFGKTNYYSSATSTFYDLLNSGFSPPYLSYPDGPWALNSFIDINGDGLPDLVLPPPTGGSVSNYIVDFNNGKAVEGGVIGNLGVEFGKLLSEGYTNENGGWNSTDYSVDESSGGTGNLVQMVKLIDINGDGLPDRVLTKAGSPYDRFKVQLNTGSGFGPLIDWTNVQSEAGSSSQPWNSINYTTNGSTVVTLIDINGDGLPDRVIRKLNPPYTNFEVQLNLGPFPDLLCNVSNGIGGSVAVTYLPSSKYDNTDRTWTNDPWAEGAKSLLPFPVYTVSTTSVNDGFGNIATNTYAYKHGMFDPISREFRGFNSVAVTDPYGAKTVTYFHQSGGFNDATNGEFQDPGTFSKKGMPYRVETWGTNGLLYRIVLNKIQEYTLNTNGWYFSCTIQTLVMNYEGLSSYRATAAQFSYDTNSENLVAETNFGEVGSVVLNGQTFTDIGSDSVYKWITYTNIGNIRNRPVDTKITSDSAGANRLQETLNSYDGNGNPTLSQSWLNTTGTYISTVQNSYDQYGNLKQTTDAAGITTTITYDSTYQQFPVSELAGTSFTSSSTFDNRSGQILLSTDAKGLVSSNSYDVLFRPSASYISTNSNGSPTLWQSRTFYSLGGISNGVSYNVILSQVNDAVDPVNGFQTYSFADGLGRSIESRAESETSGQYRAANTVYDSRGNPYFQTLSYFSSGTNYTVPSGTYLGALTAYDSIGRAFQSTPSVNGSFTSGQLGSTTATGGDTGSPVGTATTAFLDGSNPWATVVTDANGKVKKSYRDAYGRTVQVTDIVSSGNVNTTYAYDLLGDLTNITDNANNSISLRCDSLGRKTYMNDPDMGTWSYIYDSASRLTQQTDARTNTIKYYFNDQLGRLTSKQIFNTANLLVGTVSYTYDASDDPNYTVYPGQIYKVTDLQGFQRSSYDVRGRILKSGRFLNINAVEYIKQASYDDADRIQQFTYPGGSVIINYLYDTAGHLIQVKSVAGTGTQEIFYTPQSYNALGQLTGYTNGNGVVTAYAYFANSERLQNLTTSHGGTNYQNLSYTYDNSSDVSSINDGVNSGAASASLNNIVYDDLYRVTSLNSTARGIKMYGYNSIGNILTNQDFGSGLYQYGAQPHAVSNANGINYGYDACGNMITRGNETLAYDAQNQLALVMSTNDNVTFGYDDSGKRLWRSGTNGYSIWIGGIYEINNGHVLCHVFAGNRRVATFESQCNSTNPLFYYYHSEHLGSASVLTDRSANQVQHYEYTTFGSAGYTESSSAFPVSNRYTDKTYDYETGLYYYGARYYDAQLGRFTQPDPTVPGSANSQNFNRYSYSRNNPLRLVDPDGMAPRGPLLWYDPSTWIFPQVGTWSGSPGNSFWYPPEGSVAYAQTGGLPIKFTYGVPDFAPYASEITVGGVRLPSTFPVDNLTGSAKGDRSLAIEELSTRTGLEYDDIDAALSENGIQIHHYWDGEMQLVTVDLNGPQNVLHSGPASSLRAGYPLLGDGAALGDGLAFGASKALATIGIVGLLMDPASVLGGPTTTFGDATFDGYLTRQFNHYASILDNPSGYEASDIQKGLDYFNTGYTIGASGDPANFQIYMNYELNSAIQSGGDSVDNPPALYIPPSDSSSAGSDPSDGDPPPNE